MRTFSLIWSGIGCSATVAITVLGGVILANGTDNRSRAADGDTYLFLSLCNDFGYNRDYYEYPYEYRSDFDGVESIEGILNFPDSSCAYVIWGSPPFTVKLTLKRGYRFNTTEFRRRPIGEYDITYEDNAHVMCLTTVGSGYKSRFYFNFNGLSDIDGYLFTIELLIKRVSEENNIITSHISMDE
jgi:hypothetical protein